MCIVTYYDSYLTVFLNLCVKRRKSFDSSNTVKKKKKKLSITDHTILSTANPYYTRVVHTLHWFASTSLKMYFRKKIIMRLPIHRYTMCKTDLCALHALIRCTRKMRTF